MEGEPIAVGGDQFRSARTFKHVVFYDRMPPWQQCAVTMCGGYSATAQSPLCWSRVPAVTFGITKEWCICVGEKVHLVAIPQPVSVMALQMASTPMLEVSTGERAECSERYAGNFLGLKSQGVMDAAHFASAGVVSFARGLNDTPKIAALLLVIRALDVRMGMGAIALAMAIGGLLSASKVAETMSLE